MIFLQILKIIGIVLACIVGFILLVLLLVMFAPVRYRIKASGEGADIIAVAKVRWLLGFLTAGVNYAEKSITYYVKIIGIKIFKGSLGQDEDDKNDDSDDKNSEEQSSDPATALEKRPEAVEVKYESGKHPEITTRKLSEVAAQENTQTEESGAEKACTDEDQDTSQKAKKQRKTLKETYDSIINKIKELYEKIKHLYELVKKVKYILGAPVTKRALAKLKITVIRILKTLRPRTVKGEIAFGMDDPATTAQIYGIVANVASMIDDRLVIVPDMDRKYFGLNILIKGRIFIGYVVISGLKLILNRDVRRVIKYIRRNF